MRERCDKGAQVCGRNFIQLQYSGKSCDNSTVPAGWDYPSGLDYDLVRWDPPWF